MNNKIYLYGGINEKSEILECMEIFDAVTYKFQKVTYRKADEQLAKGR